MSDAGAVPAPVYGGGQFIADSSIWARTNHAAVQPLWAAAIENDQICTCPIVRLELLYTTRNPTEMDELEDELSVLRDIPITRSTIEAAIGAIRELAQVSHGYHRVSPPDAIIAAAAQDAGGRGHPRGRSF